MQIPAVIQPALKKVALAFSNQEEMLVWEVDEKELLLDSMLELGIELFNSTIDLSTLPKGYQILAFLYDWETQCQFSGWQAFEDRAKLVPDIIEYYSLVGLKSESKALKLAHKAWKGSEKDYDATNEAYNSVKNEYAIDFDRMLFIAQFLKSHDKEFFYAK